jgi:hypothetical protein
VILFALLILVDLLTITVRIKLSFHNVYLSHFAKGKLQT